MKASCSAVAPHQWRSGGRARAVQDALPLESRATATHKSHTVTSRKSYVALASPPPCCVRAVGGLAVRTGRRGVAGGRHAAAAFAAEGLIARGRNHDEDMYDGGSSEML